MKNHLDPLLARITELGPSLLERGVFLAGEAAAHAHLAAVTGSSAKDGARYAALAPRRITILGSDPASTRAVAEALQLDADESAVAEVVAPSLALFGTEVVLGDGTRLPVLSREAALAELLSQGGFALGLAGVVVRLCGEPSLDVDEIRELLKAARQGARFQPLLELLAVA